MHQPSDQLRPARQTRGTDAIGILPNKVGSTGGAFLGHRERLTTLAAGNLDPFDHLGNHIAGALDTDTIALAQILLLNLPFVVHRRAADGHSADVDRRQEGHRCEHSRHADLNDDLLQRCHLLAWWELPRQCPAGAAIAASHFLLQAPVVDLDHDPVHFERKFIATTAQLLMELPHLVQ